MINISLFYFLGVNFFCWTFILIMFESICDHGFEDCAKYPINDVRHSCCIPSRNQLRNKQNLKPPQEQQQNSAIHPEQS